MRGTFNLPRDRNGDDVVTGIGSGRVPVRVIMSCSPYFGSGRVGSSAEIDGALQTACRKEEYANECRIGITE